MDAFEIHIPRTGDATVLTSRHVPLRPPGPGQVTVAIEAAGIAYADIIMRRGLYSGVSLPVTPGYDLVGRVEAIGPGITDLKVGQRVAGMTVWGSYADRRNVDATWLVPASATADAAELVAVVLNGVTAWQMLHRLAHAGAGDWLLVHGATGGVGGLLLDYARLRGIRTIGTASAGKLDLVQERGGVAVDYRNSDVARQTLRISDGGVHAAFDHIGGRHFRAVTLPSLRPSGTAIVYGGYEATAGGKVRPLAVVDLLFNSRLSAYDLFRQTKSVATYNAPAWRDQRLSLYRADLAKVLELVATGAVRPLIAARLPLADAAAGQQLVEARTTPGKVVLIP